MPTLRTRASKGSELTHNELDANFTRPVAQKTTTYQVVVGDNRSVIEGNHATTPFTITLPTVANAAAAETGDFEVTITNINAAVVSVDASGSEEIDGSTTAIALVQWQSITVKLDSADAAWKVVSEYRPYRAAVEGSLQTPSGVTEVDFTGIPSWASQITLTFNGLSVQDSPLIVQLGDASSFESSGYESYSGRITDTNSQVNRRTNGFGFDDDTDDADQVYGSMIFTRMDTSTNLWAMQGVSGKSNTRAAFLSGTKALTGELTRIRITTAGGTDTFDAGTTNIRYA